MAKGARGPARPPGPEVEPELTLPRAQFEPQLDDRIVKGELLHERAAPAAAAGVKDLRDEYYSWHEFNMTLLRRCFTTSKIAEQYDPTIPFVAFGGSTSPSEELRHLRDDIRRGLRGLRSLKEQLDLYEGPVVHDESELATSNPPDSYDVFLVHGHDGSLREEVAEFLSRLTGSRPTILHEQPNAGQTIIEKFETHAGSAGFAVVLLTADDAGGSRDDESVTPRARQNVVFELGFFFGTLGRRRVVALYEQGVELPSDIDGLLYVAVSGNWKLQLAKEVKAAGLPADLNAAI